MSPHQLIEATARDPASDAPRLALAAQLTADGDPLGAFVAAEVARVADDRRHGRRQPDPADVAVDRLPLEAAVARWRELVPAIAFVPAKRVSLIRGLPGKLRIKWSDLARAERWWEHAPIQHLDLVGKRRPGDMERLCALPVLEQLESLSLQASELGDAEAAQLAAVAFPALRWLDLEENQIGPAGMEALVARGRWPRLVIAKLEYNRASAAEVPLYESDLGTDDVATSQGRRGAADAFGNRWDDYVQDTHTTVTSEELAKAHGKKLWTRVWWRSRREVPVRTYVWTGLRDQQLAGEDCNNAVFVAAQLVGVRAANSRWRAANLAGTHLEDCDFSGADWTWATFLDGIVERCRFGAAVLATAELVGARVRDCDFARADLRDAVFAGAEVVDTSFRGAQLGCEPRHTDPTRMVGARFVRCDFRGADFAGRELRDTSFIDCAFAASSGAPRIEGAVTIERPDFSFAGDRTDVRDPDALLRHWSRS
jgi:hypothetical protein